MVSSSLFCGGLGQPLPLRIFATQSHRLPAASAIKYPEVLISIEPAVCSTGDISSYYHWHHHQATPPLTCQGRRYYLRSCFSASLGPRLPTTFFPVNLCIFQIAGPQFLCVHSDTRGTATAGQPMPKVLEPLLLHECMCSCTWFYGYSSGIFISRHLCNHYCEVMNKWDLVKIESPHT